MAPRSTLTRRCDAESRSGQPVTEAEQYGGACHGAEASKQRAEDHDTRAGREHLWLARTVQPDLYPTQRIPAAGADDMLPIRHGLPLTATAALARAATCRASCNGCPTPPSIAS